MVQKRFVCVVLASIISSRVIAAPTAQVSSDPEPPAMCDDVTIPWEDRKKVCSICDIPGVPRGVYLKYCGEDGPGTHRGAEGVWRRDGAANRISDEPEDQTMGVFDSIIHNPAPGVWRRTVVTLPAAPIVHGHASDVSDGGNEPLNGKK